MKTDNTTEITSAKILACQEKYFTLFDKYIPDNVYTKDNNVLLFDICNEGCIELIVQKNPNATYFIYDNLENTDAAGLCDTLPELMPNTKFVFIDNKYDNIDLDKQFEYNLSDMKFDCIIMNPPYQRNLHLKILAEAITHLKNNESVCVNLSPIRWLQDPIHSSKKITDFKRFENSVSKHIKNIDLIKAATANSLFGIQNFTDLGIYECNNSSNNTYDYKNILIDEYLGNRKSIFTKIWNYCLTSNMADKIQFNLDGISVKFNVLFGGHNNPYTLVTTNHSHPYINGVTEDGKTYAQCAFKKKDVDENKQTQSTVKFDTINEAKNFIKSVQTEFFMFVNSLTKRDVHVSPSALPWMGESINPRTGLKGYESEWTDEDFYTFFNITPDEQKIIEETMEKYK